VVARLPVQTLRLRFLVVAVALSVPGVSLGQIAPEWTIRVSNVRLDDALRVFASRTGSAVAYDPQITRDIRISCTRRGAEMEEYLSCLLQDTGLEFFRRASGTYVIGLSMALPDAFGIVSGRVSDSSSGDPLQKAHVRVAGISRGTITSQAGGFLLADLLPGRYAVSVTHVGYAAWTDSVDVIAGARTRVRARLASSVHSMDPLIVQESGTSLLPRQEPQRVTANAIRSASPTSAFSDMTSRIGIQGSDAGDLRLRLDGSPIYLPREFAAFIGPFSREAVSSVRVSTAGFGAGDGSLLGGVLDFAPRLQSANRLSVSVDPLSLDAAAGGSRQYRNLSRTRVFVAARIGLWNRSRPNELVRTVASWSRTDPFLLFGPLRDYSNVTEESVRALYDLAPVVPNVRFNDLHGTLQHERASGQTWRLSFYQADRGLSGDRRIQVQESALAADSPLVSSVAAHDWRTSTATLSLRDMVGTRTFAEFALRGSRYRYRHDYSLVEQLGVTLADARNTLAGTQTRDGNDLDELSARLRLDQSRGRHALSAGAELVHTASRFDLRLASIGGGELVDVLAAGPDLGSGIISLDTTSVFFVRHGAVTNRSRSLRLVGWLADRFEMDRLSFEASARFTLRPDRQTVYAEPRARVAWEVEPGVVVAWSGGLYRQFVNQFDFSSINAGELVPSVRIWLPLDRSLSPPRALHSALDLDWQLSTSWQLSGSFYWKRIDGGLVINYGIDPGLIVEGASLSQREILTERDARHSGASASASYSGRAGAASFRYQFARDRVRSPALFAGRWLPAPWEVPHRLQAEWSGGFGPASLTLAATVEAGKTWALRQVYYDYFGQVETSREHPGWNLGRPDEHRQPTNARLDIGVNTEKAFGPTVLELRLEVRNALDSANQIDQRLLWSGSNLIGDPRYLPGRTVVIGVRAAW
jgi:Carboxypeptidase regulatory-like domain